MAWYDEAVFYHIYPLGLLGAPKQNEYGKPEHRLKELDPWIKHISDIGCNAIYIGPLFESVGHGYETTDYKKLDSRLGDNKDLKNFVAKCHKAGIKVIFDGVFNHTGRDFFAFKDIQANREGSRYRDWYCNVNFYGNNEYNDGFSYDNWGGYNLMAKFNQRNPEVKDYIADVIRFWVSEFDVDGLRLDAADVLDFDFMKMLRAVANEVKPDFWLMGEVIHGDYTRWVNEGTLHSVTNYTLHKALYSGCNDHNFFEIAHTVKRLYEMGGNRPDGLKLYNFSDNHDVERIITKLNNKSNFAPVHIMVYTLPGVPSIYYGSEFGIEGKKEKFSDDSLRPALNMNDFKDAVKNNPYTALIAQLGKIRQNTPALSYGNYVQNTLTNRQYVYTRNTDNSTVIVALNNDENPCDVGAGGIRDGEYIGAIGGSRITVSGGNFHVHLEANSGEIFVPADGDKTIKPISVNLSQAAPVKVEKKAEAEVEAKTPVAVAEEAKPAAPAVEPAKKEEKAKPKKVKKGDFVGAGQKYGLDEKYNEYNPDEIKNRNDYENMCIEELQVAILEKMAKNGNVDANMIKTVMDNVYLDSLKNWVRSFH